MHVDGLVVAYFGADHRPRRDRSELYRETDLLSFNAREGRESDGTGDATQIAGPSCRCSEANG
jgi:hypothetical protein